MNQSRTPRSVAAGAALVPVVLIAAWAASPLASSKETAAVSLQDTAGDRLRDREPTAQEQPTAKPSPAKAQDASPPSVGHFATDPDTLSTPTFVSVSWLVRHRERVTVVDTRESAEVFAQGHVPGAVHAPIGLVREARDGVRDELLPAAALAPKIGGLGIEPETEVVIYGDHRLQDPAHFAVALLRLGHRRLALLEGGINAWRKAGHPLATETRKPVAKTYSPRPGADDFSAVLADVKAASKGGGVKILDTRPAAAFAGEETQEARGGHIPKSLNREIKLDLVTTDAGVFLKPAEELQRAYAGMGLAPDVPVIVSCRTGHQAAQTFFVLRYALGRDQVRWYDGSWQEWAAHAELPAEAEKPRQGAGK